MSKTSATSKRPSATPVRANRLGSLVPLLLIGSLALTGCNSVTRKKIEAAVWATNAPIPAELCEREPEVSQYGFFRRLNDGRLEFVSFCKKEASLYVTMYSDDFERIMNEAFGTRKTRATKGTTSADGPKAFTEIHERSFPASYQEVTSEPLELSGKPLRDLITH